MKSILRFEIVLIALSVICIVIVNAMYEDGDGVSEGEVDYWWISGVAEGELFLLTVDTNTIHHSQTQLCYSNLTVKENRSQGRTHIYEFIVDKTDNYLLRVFASTSGFNYTIKYTHLYMGHNIALDDISLSKTVVGEGFSVKINVSISNIGNFTETIEVQVFCNSTVFETTTNQTLRPNETRTLEITWNTTGFNKGNYIIYAQCIPVPDETTIIDNTIYADKGIFVTIVGDVDGDRDVDIYDVVKITSIYRTQIGDDRYKPNSDIDGNGEIDIYDVVHCTSNYRKSW